MRAYLKGLGRRVAIASCVPFLAAAAQAVRIDQDVVSRNLLNGTPEQKSTAANVAQHLKVEAMGPELRAALISALAEANRFEAERSRAILRGESRPPLFDPEYRAKLLRAIIKLDDPAAIPALAGALGTGGMATDELADFGETAAPAVLAAVRSTNASTSTLQDGLIALRLMVEGTRIRRPISAGTRQAIREVAIDRLRRTNQHVTVLWFAIDLASSLGGGPDMTAELRRIAVEPAALAGVTSDSEMLAATRKRAADRLSGIKPLPRRQ